MSAPKGVGTPSCIRWIGDEVELRIKVVPGASRSEIVGPLGGRLKVRVAAPAESGKANRAVVDLVREWLSTRDVQIVAGQTSSAKTLRVSGMDESGRTRLSSLKERPSARGRAHPEEPGTG